MEADDNSGNNGLVFLNKSVYNRTLGQLSLCTWSPSYDSLFPSGMPMDIVGLNSLYTNCLTTGNFTTDSLTVGKAVVGVPSSFVDTLIVKSISDGKTEVLLDGTSVGGHAWAFGAGYSGAGLDNFYVFDASSSVTALAITPSGNLVVSRVGVFGWTPTRVGAVPDVALSRLAPASLALGNGTFGNVGGKLFLAHVNVNSLISYPNNAAAIVGGLVAGDLYRTGADPDVVCVVH